MPPNRTRIKVDIDQLLQQAIAAHQERDLALAEQLYKRVLSIEPNHIDATHYLALIAQEVDRHDVAVKLFAKAISLSSSDANLHYNFGLSLQQLGNSEQAKHQYYEAIKNNPRLSQAYNNLGAIYQQEGMHDKASALFQKAISLNPEFADAYFNLAQSKKFRQYPAFADSLEALLENAELSQGDAVACHFALGKIYDDLRLYDQAFNHFQAGNTLKPGSFNISAYHRYVETIEAVFETAVLNKARANTPAIGELIFILGMPRSGTTLVEQIVSSHPKVTAGGEMGIIGELIDNLDSILNISQGYPQCIPELSSNDIGHLSDRLLIELERAHPGFLVLTDKTPVNFLHVGLIHLLYPNSRIIHCQRDPLDTCLSCFFQNFNRQHHYSNDLKTLGQFYRMHEKLMSTWKTRLPDRILTLRYEELVSDSEEQIRRILAYCELEWSDACLNFNENTNKISTASNWQARQPLYNSSIQRWKNYRPYLRKLIEGLEMDQKLLL